MTRQTAGSASPGEEPPSDGVTCANCGASLQGAFCHECGQEAVELRRPLRSLVGEALGNLLAFDSRILATLRPLLLTPGFLTEEWVAGRRVRYVPPLRLYFFIAALFFLLVGWADFTLLEVHETGESSGTQVTAGSVARVEVTGSGPQTAEQDESGEVLDGEESRASGITDEAAGAGDAASAADPDSDGGLFAWFGERLGAALSRDQEAFGEDLMTHLGRISLLLPPFLAPLLALLYRRRDRVLVEHVVFSLHLHAFALLLLSVHLALSTGFGLGEAAQSVTKALAQIGIGVYLVLALRRVYDGGWWGTVARATLLLVLYLVFIFLPAVFLALVWTVLES